MKPKLSTQGALRFALSAMYTAADHAAERADELERRLRVVETNLQSVQRGFPYAGVWREGKTYPADTFATHNGGLWFCRAETTSRPGDDGDWTLCVKAGRR